MSINKLNDRRYKYQNFDIVFNLFKMLYKLELSHRDTLQRGADSLWSRW